MITTARTIRTTAISALLAAGAALSFVATASAKDLSLPFRNYPGFSCHHSNAQGECTDWSYFDYTTPAPAPVYPSYPGPSYPTYPTSPTHPAGNGDVTVSVSTGRSVVDEGDLLIYSIFLRNDSSRDRRIDVRAFLDTDTEFHSANNGGDEDGDEVSWDNVLVNRRSSRTLSLTVRVDDNVRDGDTLRLRVEADGEDDDVTVRVRNGGSSNSNSSNDDCDTCDVTVRVTASDDEIDEGELLTYSIYVRNDDSSDANVDVRAFLDTDTDFYSASDGGRESGSQVRWDNLVVRRRSSRTIALTVRTDSDLDDGDTLRLRVEAGDDEDDVDTAVDTGSSNSSDNDCNGACDITLRVAATPTTANVNELVTFTIVLENDDNRFHTVDVRGLLDDNLVFYSASDGGRDRGDGEVEWDSVSVNADSSRTITVSGRVHARADSGDRLRFSAETDDDTDNVTIRVR